MTIGQKIRYYRTLRGYTQADLGKKVGLMADRIRQYENDVRTPKEDKLIKIADALDVDVAALSDINITSAEDIMHILFELEDNHALRLEKIDGKSALIIDDTAENNTVLCTYLNYWYDKRQAFSLENGNEARTADYISWRGRFGSNETAFEDNIKQKIRNTYEADIKRLSKEKTKHCVITSDLARILCKIPLNTILSTCWRHIRHGVGYPGFIFDVGKLLNPESYSEDFAQFLYELDYLKTLGLEWYSEIEYTESTLKIVYYLPVASFADIQSHVNDWLNFYKNQECYYSDLAIEEFELMFEDSLTTYYNNIKEEIERSIALK